MSDVQEKFKMVFADLQRLSVDQKIQFLHIFLFECTIGGRAIWSDEHSADIQKLDALKWLNELNHRVWNIIFDLHRKEDSNTSERIYGNIKFYAEQSSVLRSQLVPCLLGAFDQFKRQQ